MSVYQIEKHITDKLFTNLNGLKNYLSAEEYSPDRKDFHNSIRNVDLKDGALSFLFLGREFLILIEPLLTQEKGCLKTLMKVNDLEKYPDTKWEYIPSVNLYVDMSGNGTLANDSNEDGSTGEKYFRQLTKFITEMESRV